MTYLWTPQLTRSFWIDELTSFWVINGDLPLVIHRTINTQGESPLYFIILWLVKYFLGPSEVALRAPSILAIIITTVLIYKFAHRHLGLTTAALAAIIFLLLKPTGFAALNARPYGFAILFATASVIALVSWTEADKLRYQIAYVITTALTVYFHPIFLGILALHGLYLASIYRRRSHVRLNQVFLSWIAVGLLASPNIYQILLLQEKADLIRIASPPSLFNSASILLPTPLITCALVTLTIVVFRRAVVRDERFLQVPTINHHLWLIVAWWVLPVLILVAYSLVTGRSLMVDRYASWMAGGAALFFAFLIRTIPNTQLQHLATVAILLVIACTPGTHRANTPEGWRAAVHHLNETNNDPRTPLFVYTGLIETIDPSWLTDPERRAYILSPFAPYPTDYDTTPLPAFFEAKSQLAYWESHVAPVLASHPYVTLLIRSVTTLSGGHKALPSEVFVLTKFSNAGYRPIATAEFENIHVIRLAAFPG